MTQPAQRIAADVEQKALEHSAGQAMLADTPPGWEFTLYTTRRAGQQTRSWCAYGVKLTRTDKHETTPCYAALAHVAYAQAVADAVAFEEKEARNGG